MALCHHHLENDASNCILGCCSHFPGSLGQRASDDDLPAMDILPPHDSKLDFERQTSYSSLKNSLHHFLFAKHGWSCMQQIPWWIISLLRATERTITANTLPSSHIIHSLIILSRVVANGLSFPSFSHMNFHQIQIDVHYMYYYHLLSFLSTRKGKEKNRSSGLCVEADQSSCPRKRCAFQAQEPSSSN